ncbi:hypothetical protein YPPY66_2466 [Yersinia pestis PY-66]|nr:hypothetical protein YpF1991016_3860 [Yersinia pestis biovar Orientalis str. F1991016]EDR60838.1 hypothetical protein YpUG050454_3334 [Yersinia pestis biovar Antiqua str. UG05-0454]EIQ90424.1 hypothetical protein YPPY02_2222 [Yersinia pestis PY-02]EIQ91433.1 hypothetical protein YPPY03_2308 [Yersinia pestis PY-03]EIR04256.1 hypothetical protein YPPY05_2221 [Yersinia pestis PY-05]EIR06943.1 hypothetical protein YPPY06_2286 [Yersinia pestis PY-06]EIR21115.1 hypothetical protein YPPY09_2289 [
MQLPQKLCGFEGDVIGWLPFISERIDTFIFVGASGED